MTPSVLSRPRPQPTPQTKRGDQLLYVALALAAVALVALVTPALEPPPVVSELRIDNPYQWNVNVAVTDADREGWMALGSVSRERTSTVADVIDQGERWIFSFGYGGVDGGELELTRTELELADWRITVPEIFSSRMRAAGLPPSS